MIANILHKKTGEGLKQGYMCFSHYVYVIKRKENDNIVDRIPLFIR